MSNPLDNISVRLLNRDFSFNRYALNVTLTPTRFSIDALGGYATAEIDISGDTEAMFALTDMLRCGVELYDRAGQTVWSGIVWSVELPWGARVIGRSLETAANTVQVAYNRPERTVGRTAWAVNARHSARYGIKELVGDASDASDGQAIAYRDTLLAMRGIWPAPKIVSRSGNKSKAGKITCIGLYRTLDWRYYTNAEIGLSRPLTGASDVADIVWNDSYDVVENLTIQFGDAAASSEMYFWFTCNATHPVTLSKMEFKLVKVGSPADTLTADLVRDNAGVPGALLQSSSVSASTLAITHTWQAFSFQTLLLPGTTYGIKLRRSGAVSATDYFRAASHSGLGYTNGQSKVNNAGTWVVDAGPSDVLFRLESKGPPLIDMGAVTARSFFAQKFTMDSASASYGIIAAQFNAAQVGTTVVDNLKVQIWSDIAGVPGTLYGEATVPGTQIRTTLTEVAVSFAGVQVTPVTAGSPLWLIVRRTGAIDSTSYYILEADRATPSFTLDTKYWNGGTYAALSAYKWMPYGVTYGVETMEQVRRIATASGQFFTALDIHIASGVYAPAYATGDSTALRLISELLAMGTSTGKRLNARVTDERRLQIYFERDLDTEAWYEAEDGTIRTSRGSEVPDDMTVGVWVMPQSLPGGEQPTDWAHFIERTEWSKSASAASATISRASRDTRNAFDVFGVQNR